MDIPPARPHASPSGGVRTTTGVHDDLSAPRQDGPEGRGDDRGRAVSPAASDGDVRPDPAMDVESLDRDTLRELRSLGPVGMRVGRHLLTAAAVVDADPEEALRQLRAAVQRGSRLPVVRETAGVVGYAAGDFAFALRELRTASRLGVGAHLLPLIVDCERALGHPERALDLAAAGARGLDAETAVELAIVVSGIHRDRGDRASALAALAPAGVVEPAPRTPAGVRLRYARAAVLAADDPEASSELFVQVARDDVDGLTDAAERVAEAAGLLFDDLADDDVVDDDVVDDDVVDDDLADDDLPDSDVADDRAGAEPMSGDLRDSANLAADDQRAEPGTGGSAPTEDAAPSPTSGVEEAAPVADTAESATPRRGTDGRAALGTSTGEATTATEAPGSSVASPQRAVEVHHGDEHDKSGAAPA